MTLYDDLDTLDMYLHVGVPMEADHMLAVRERAISALARIRNELCVTADFVQVREALSAAAASVIPLNNVDAALSALDRIEARR